MFQPVVPAFNELVQLAASSSRQSLAAVYRVSLDSIVLGFKHYDFLLRSPPAPSAVLPLIHAAKSKFCILAVGFDAGPNGDFDCISSNSAFVSSSTVHALVLVLAANRHSQADVEDNILFSIR